MKGEGGLFDLVRVELSAAFGEVVATVVIVYRVASKSVCIPCLFWLV